MAHVTVACVILLTIFLISPSTAFLAARAARQAQVRVPALCHDSEEELLTTLRVEVGGEVGAVSLYAPVSRVTRWPAGDLWPSGRALARHLCARPEEVAGLRVLEVGTGLGLVSLCCAELGAREVIASDVDAVAVALVLQSHADHGIGGGGDVCGATVNWSRGWRAAAAEVGAVDVVVASDVLYEASKGPSLACFLSEFLDETPRGVALVMNPLVGRGQDGRDGLVATAAALGVRTEAESFVDPVAPVPPPPARHNMELLRLTKAVAPTQSD